VLKQFADEQHAKHDFTLNAANEIEGFLFKGVEAERYYHETGRFEYVTPAAIIIRCLAIRFACLSTKPPKCSAPWFPERKGSPRSGAFAV